jgi:hypothetical protein
MLGAEGRGRNSPPDISGNFAVLFRGRVEVDFGLTFRPLTNAASQKDYLGLYGLQIPLGISAGGSS